MSFNYFQLQDQLQQAREIGVDAATAQQIREVAVFHMCSSWHQFLRLELSGDVLTGDLSLDFTQVRKKIARERKANNRKHWQRAGRQPPASSECAGMQAELQELAAKAGSDVADLERRLAASQAQLVHTALPVAAAAIIHAYCTSLFVCVCVCAG